MPLPSPLAPLVPCARGPVAAARFSPDDKFSSQRVTLKKRFGILPTQGPKPQF
jgi:hypothetical protein